MLLLRSKTNIRNTLSQVSQPASAGNGADLVNCKLITRQCPGKAAPYPPVEGHNHSYGPHNTYCISNLEPSLCPWILLFWFLPSMQSRWIKDVISWFVNFEKELGTIWHYSSFCKVVVTSEQGQLLIKSWPSPLNVAGFALVRWNSRGNLRHNECAVECCAIAL